jgi:hypothetical protein
MRPSPFSIALVSALLLSAGAYAAPVPGQKGYGREALAMRLDTLDPTRDPVSVAFRLEDWLQDNGSGGFPPDFSDEDRRSDPWENPPQ